MSSRPLRRQRAYRVFALLGAALVGTACSSLDSLNPFSSSKNKLPELEPLRQNVALQAQWQNSVGEAGDFAFTPAIYGSTVFAADKSGTLARFDDGKEVWRVRAEVPFSGGVGSNGKLIAVGTAKGQIFAYDDKGRPVWNAKVSSEVLAAPVVTADMVFIRGGDNRITALAAADGKQRWIYQRPTPALTLRSSVGVVAVQDKAVIAGFPGGKLVAISMLNGAPLWEVTVAIPKGATELERVADITSNPAIDGKQICAVAYQGRLACFDLGSGEPMWTRDISSTAGLDMDGRYVYVSDDGGSVQAFDRRTGASIWKQDKLKQRELSRPLVVGNYVAVGDGKGVLHLLRQADGAFAGRTELSGAIAVGPVASGKGMVVQTSRGSLAYYQP